MAPSLKLRVSCAVAIAVGCAAIAYWHLKFVEPETLGFDFTWPWRAARALLTRTDPYVVIQPTGPFPFDGYFTYPIPAAIVAIPFVWMTPAAAAAVFGGMSAGLLTFALLKDGFARIPLLLSAPFLVNLLSGQWSSLMMAAALLPGISWLAVCKPTVGGAAFVYRPNRFAVLGSVILLGASFAFVPGWLPEWLSGVRHNPFHRYIPPVSLIGGPLLLLSALRWRRPEARWLFVLAIAPQVLTFYTALPPTLVAQTRRESIGMAALSTIAWLAWEWQRGPIPIERTGPIYAGYWILCLVFLPALVMVLRRPNVGAVPEWIERAVGHAPAWIRGSGSDPVVA